MYLGSSHNTARKDKTVNNENTTPRTPSVMTHDQLVGCLMKSREEAKELREDYGSIQIRLARSEGILQERDKQCRSLLGERQELEAYIESLRSDLSDQQATHAEVAHRRDELEHIFTDMQDGVCDPLSDGSHNLREALASSRRDLADAIQARVALVERNLELVSQYNAVQEELKALKKGLEMDMDLEEEMEEATSVS